MTVHGVATSHYTAGKHDRHHLNHCIARLALAWLHPLVEHPLVEHLQQRTMTVLGLNIQECAAFCEIRDVQTLQGWEMFS